MDCRETQTALGRGAADDADVAAHLAECADCRAAAEAVRETDAILAPLLRATGEPSAAGAERTAAAVRDQMARTVGGPPRITRVLFGAAAALALLIAGGLGGWLLHSASPRADSAGLSSVTAAHELEVFKEVREALGGDLAWLATVDGEVVVGLSTDRDLGELRVVLLEVRDEAGGVLARLNVVVPDGRKVQVGVPGAPRICVSIEGSHEPGGRLVCSLEFADGARIETPGLRLMEGETALLGKVRTDGSVRSVFVAHF